MAEHGWLGRIAARRKHAVPRRAAAAAQEFGRDSCLKRGRHAASPEYRKRRPRPPSGALQLRSEPDVTGEGGKVAFHQVRCQWHGARVQRQYQV